MRGLTAILGVVIATLVQNPAAAGPLDGVATCTLTLSTSGTLKMAGDGRTMTSLNSTGGLPAAMALVGVNLVPELVFSAPTVIGPTGWTSTPITAISVDTLSGTHTGFSSGGLTVRPGVLIDTLSINAMVTSDAGFKAGSYSVSSQVTCQSAS